MLHVEDVLGYAQLNAGKFSKNIKSFNVRKMVNDIIGIKKFQAESKNVALHQDDEDELLI